MGFFDFDDLLVGPPNASYFDTKAWVEGHARRHARCGVMRTTWVHVEPGKADFEADPWARRPGPTIAEKLRERPIGCRRREAKMLMNPAAVRRPDPHHAQLCKGFKRCHVPLITIHARESFSNFPGCERVPEGITPFQMLQQGLI
jgi:hypothetical protein